MTTDLASRVAASDEVDVQSYQQFWENVGPDVLERYAGKFVAMEHNVNGWEIVQTSDDLDDLQAALVAGGADLSKVVFDRVHIEDATAVGIELQ